MINTKSCPRCRIGDVFDGNDEYGSYKVCIQCGNIGYPKKPLDIEVARAELGRHVSRR